MQGYKGPWCQEPDCPDPDCSGHGFCVAGRCVCRRGWLGAECAAVDPAAVMSQSADSSMLGGRGDNLNTAHQSPARPRTLFSNRGAGGGSTDSGIRCWIEQSTFAKFRSCLLC